MSLIRDLKIRGRIFSTPKLRGVLATTDGGESHVESDYPKLDSPVRCRAHLSNALRIEPIDIGRLNSERTELTERNFAFSFQRNEVALKYQEVIALQMKKKQSEYYGNQYKKVDLRPNEQKSIAKPTTTRKELSKIAGTSEGSIQRTKLILGKGTPEQISR